MQRDSQASDIFDVYNTLRNGLAGLANPGGSNGSLNRHTLDELGEFPDQLSGGQA